MVSKFSISALLGVIWHYLEHFWSRHLLQLGQYYSHLVGKSQEPY